MSLSRWAAPAVLLVAVLSGTYLRLWPSLPTGRTEFLSDGATVARLALASARSGRLPAVDSLAEAPAGRALGPVFAPGLIVGAGAFHRLMAALGSRDPAMDLTLFGALAGGLIAVPVYLWARVQWGAGMAAPFAALLVAFLPAHLHRTFGYFMRYEAIGSLLVAAHLACLAAALADQNRRRRWVWAAAAAAFIVVALWTWRVPLIIPLFEAMLWAALLVARGAQGPVREVFTVQTVALTASMVAIEYLRAQRVMMSGGWLAACAVAALAYLPRLAPARSRWVERAAWLAGGMIAAVLLGGAAESAGAYGSTGSFLVVKLRSMVGLPVAPDPITRLMLVIEELRSMSPAFLLFNVINFACLGPWLLLAPVVLWKAAGSPRLVAIREAPPQTWLLHGMTLALLALSLFAHRAKVLAAPAAAVLVAGLLPALLARSTTALARPVSAGEKSGPGGKRRGARQARGGAAPARKAGAPSPVRGTLAVLLLASFAGNVWFSVVIAGTRTARIPDGQRAAMAFLRERTPADAIVATLWEEGFEVQSYAHRRTLLDGFLESVVGRRRIVELAQYGFERSPEPLAAWCARLGAGYLLVPPSSHLIGLATLAAPELLPALRANAPLPAAQLDRTLMRMMLAGGDQPPFRLVFEREHWRVYALGGSSR